MDVVLFIVGILFLWKGSMKISKKAEPWPKSKRSGRIIGGILLIPFIFSLTYGVIIGFSSVSNMNNKAPLFQSLAIGSPYINQQYGFQIVPPSNWIVVPASALKNEDPSNGKIVEFFDNYNNVQGVMTVSLMPIPTIMSTPQLTNSQLDQYINNTVKDLQSAPGYLSADSYKVASSTGTLYFIESKIKMTKGSGVEDILQRYVLGKNNQLYLVSGGSDDVLWPSFKGKVNNSLLSFSLN